MRIAESAAPNISSYPHNLFTLFGHYYDLKVFETVTQLCPADKCGQTGSPTAFTDLAEETAKVYKSIVWPTETPPTPPPRPWTRMARPPTSAT